MLDLLIRGGTLVLADQTAEADVGVQDGIVVELGRLGDRTTHMVIDASNQYVFPGMIDPHVHFSHPYRDTRSTDDFHTGTRAAAAGGNTTIIDFAIQWVGTPDETVQVRKGEAQHKAIIDYGFHVCLTKSDPANIACVPKLIEAGLPSFKVYMVYRRQGRMMDDGGLLAVLQQTATHGGMTGVHAENEAMADYNEKLLRASEQLAPAYFPDCKPSIVEAEAINRVLYLNQHARSRLYIFHLSTREGLELIDQARAKGQLVWTETCTHYLVLTEEVYRTENGRGFICSPPLRSGEHAEALWEGVASGRIAVVSSDHCGFSMEQKKAYGVDFLDVPNGLPGVETRLPVLYTEGVVKGRISINKLVEVLATNPAKIFGLYPQKGTISPGTDADITVFDPAIRRVLRAKDLETPAGWSPYEGLEVHGWPTCVISRGDAVFWDGVLKAEPGRGCFLKRVLPERV